MERIDNPATTVLTIGGKDGYMSKETFKELSRELKYHRALGCAVDVHIVLKSGDTYTGVVESWGLNHPTFRFDNGTRAFMSDTRGENENSLLFKRDYGTDKRGSSFRHTIESATFTIRWFKTPTCPVCDTDMKQGMANTGTDDFFHGWICTSCFTGKFETGIY